MSDSKFFEYIVIVLLRYFINTFEWVNKENIDLFYFSSFDEVWKNNHEGEYGAYWGLWDKEGNYKFNKNKL